LGAAHGPSNNDPGSRRVFVAERTGFDQVYVDETTGAMTAYDANPVTLSDVDQSFAFGPDGDRLYSLDADGQLRIFDMDDEGLPTLVEGSPFSVSANDLSRAFAGVTSDGRFLFTPPRIRPPSKSSISAGERSPRRRRVRRKASRSRMAHRTRS